MLTLTRGRGAGVEKLKAERLIGGRESQRGWKDKPVCLKANFCLC